MRATEVFTRAATALPAAPGFVDGLRRAALDAFETEGLPSTKLENWRYTNIKRLAQREYNLSQLPKAAAGHRELAGLEAHVVTLVDGAFFGSVELSDGIVVGSLATAARDYRARVEAHLDGRSKLPGETFAALNTAYINDGVFIFLPGGTRPDRPVWVRTVARGGAGSMCHPRVLVVAEENAELTLLESFEAADGADGYLTNGVTEVVLGNGAQVRQVRIQEEALGADHLCSIDARLGRDARYDLMTLALGGALARTATTVRYDDVGAEASLAGLGIATGKQHQDACLVVDHAHGHGRSSQLFKNIVDDQASTVFNGTIVVRPQAQKTDARQSNKNLLLSEKASATTKPQLEIDADDVACAHGATVGQLDPEQIFYMRSRGFDLEGAQRELTLGFAAEILEGIAPAPLREAMNAVVRAKLQGA